MMTETVHRLIYYSPNRVLTTSEELAIAVDNILKTARRNNSHSGVTGALMLNAGCFAQVLEGHRRNVEHIFEHIQQDDRHSDVPVLSFSPVKGRCFAHWSMSFVGASVEDAARFGSIASDSGYDPSRMSGEAIFETLHRLVFEENAIA